MININNLSKDILSQTLFEKATFVLKRGDKVGLVGPNGCGKSTLLKIILGEVETDKGSVKIDNEKLGYLSQELPFNEGETVESFLSASKLKRAQTALAKVGLDKINPELSVESLSGGQKTRLSLAKIILDRPSALLLDEPTNHLDLEGLEWLEDFINNFKGIVLVVSHDRRLLDNTVEKILEIDPINKTFKEYAGDYTNYAIERERNLMKWEDEYKRQQKEKKRLEMWLVLKREEATVNPSPAKGKQIRAMEKRIQREIYDKEIAPPKSKKIKKVNLEGEVHSKKRILQVKSMRMMFPKKSIFRGASFEMYGKEHVHLTGRNGSGKTTLLKMIVGELKPGAGEVSVGANINVGYFAQEHEVLDPKSTVVDEWKRTERLLFSAHNARSILGKFMFEGAAVNKKITSLSLGERVRLIFAKLTSGRNELLILDEPTNHLDLDSREAIEDALIDYDGAILVVSHDRYFLDKIKIDRTLTIEDGLVKEVY